MKIISWNVNGIRACINKGLIDFVEKESADIFCVQETKAHPSQVEVEPEDLDGVEAFWSTAEKKGYSGTLTVVKEPVRSVKHGVGITKFDSEGRFVITEHKDFSVYNIYFPNGAMGEDRHNYKMEFLETMYEHFKKRLANGDSIVVLGDYNIAHAAIDIHDPVRLDGESGFKPEERAWMDKFFSLGFVDTYRHMHPEQKDAYTWWSYRQMARPRNKGWRIDYISVSPDLVGRIQRADIMNEIEGSDHCPIVLELKD
ncbi:MAG: exodeoxyribonuclease III [Bdellovibrionales bacterium]|nr:exodeoxyribonuclease III [Bdellovibrionales bacterium]